MIVELTTTAGNAIFGYTPAYGTNVALYECDLYIIKEGVDFKCSFLRKGLDPIGDYVIDYSTDSTPVGVDFTIDINFNFTTTSSATVKSIILNCLRK